MVSKSKDNQLNILRNQIQYFNSEILILKNEYIKIEEISQKTQTAVFKSNDQIQSQIDPLFSYSLTDKKRNHSNNIHSRKTQLESQSNFLEYVPKINYLFRNKKKIEIQKKNYMPIDLKSTMHKSNETQLNTHLSNQDTIQVESFYEESISRHIEINPENNFDVSIKNNSRNNHIMAQINADFVVNAIKQNSNQNILLKEKTENNNKKSQVKEFETPYLKSNVSSLIRDSLKDDNSIGSINFMQIQEEMKLTNMNNLMEEISLKYSNDNIIQNVPNYYPKNEHINQEENYLLQSLKKYINLSDLPLYKIDENLIHLKASSLFNDTLLFENDQFRLRCKTKQLFSSNNQKVSMKLSFIPKMDGLQISTLIENNREFEVHPIGFTEYEFDFELEQLILLDVSFGLKVTNFPILSVFVSQNLITQCSKIAIPFSINKCFVKKKMSFEECGNYLNQVVL